MASRADLERLAEGQVLDDVPLDRAEAVALNATKLVSVAPGAHGWRVTAAYAVGALQCGELTVRVRPKVGVLQVLRLLARSHGISLIALDDARVGLTDDTDLTTVLAVLFAREAASALAGGPMRGYRTEDQTLPVLRGRIRLRDQELRRFGALVPLEVTVDEWTTDSDDNRRIRAATRRLLSIPDLPDSVRHRLSHVDRLLAVVHVAPRGGVVAPWTPTRLNTRLHRLLHLADLVLDQATVEHRVGDVQVHGFVLSMWTLFERLVTKLLQENQGSLQVMAQETHDLDTRGRLSIQPDIEIRDGRVVVAVADTKYKLLDDKGKFPNADAYQLVTYCRRLGLTTGHLIYAAGDAQPEPYEIVGAGVQLVAHTVDLAQSITDVERQVGSVLRRISGASDTTGLNPRSGAFYSAATVLKVGATD
ncbi:MAG: restriction endonuclease [Frankiales bacterium]|nr:restriction endonuclease [Frankiales bacterium]